MNRRILFRKTFGTELVTNSDMELDASWSSFGTPATNERSNTRAYGGTYSRHFIENETYEGIQSAVFTIKAGSWYRISGWFYRVDAGNGSVILSFRTPPATVVGSVSFAGGAGSWRYLSGKFQASASFATAFLAAYVSGTVTNAEVYCDNLSVRGYR